MSGPSLRMWIARHPGGLLTATAVRRRDLLFDAPAPSAHGETVDEACDHVELLLHELRARSPFDFARYLWDEPLMIGRARVDVNAQALVGGLVVVGKRTVPLDLVYGVAALRGGGFRVVLPRFGWAFHAESETIVAPVLAQLVGGDLLGASPRWLAEFRGVLGEHVETRAPSWAKRDAGKSRETPLSTLYPTMAAIAEELVERARRGTLPGVVGDPLSMRGARERLDRKPRASIVLVGPSGCGKSSWVRLLARHLLQERKSTKRQTRLWSTSGDRILSGMIWLGQWQQRVLRMIDELDGEDDLLHVDRLGTLTRELGDGGSIADMLVPALGVGSVQMITEATPAEWERVQARHPALAGVLTPIRLTSTTSAEMPELLRRYQEQRAPGVAITPPAYRRLVMHLALLSRTEAFPGKGFRFLEALVPDPSRAAARVLGPRDVSAEYAKRSGLPIELVDDGITIGEPELAARLAERVIGQDHACAIAARVVARFKAGLADPERPLGVLFFTGPTGVGKTELAKQLAAQMLGSAERLVRVDMSEHYLPGSAARLLATGEGVRSLATRVREEPLSVVLLDEIEKASPDVFDLLLGVLGDGTMSDDAGRDVDFRGTVIVMTSNLGAGERPPLGFDAGPRDDFVRRVREHFRPELFGRIDHVIPFRDLSPEDVTRIVDLEIARVAERTGLVRRGVRLEASPEARVLLARLGYVPGLGARPLKRVIEERVVTPLAVQLAGDPTLCDVIARVTCSPEGSLSVVLVHT